MKASSLFAGLAVAFALAAPGHLWADAVSNRPDPTHHHHYANPDGKSTFLDQGNYIPGHHSYLFWKDNGTLGVIAPDNNVSVGTPNWVYGVASTYPPGGLY